MGVALGDLDGDGRPDAVAAALDAPAAVLQNASNAGRFLNIDPVDRHGRPAFGARVRVTAGGRIQAGQLVAGGSYLAASEPSVRFGLGEAKGITRIEVAWPWGPSEAWSRPELPARGRLRLAQGTGRPGP
jgi:hypothetical protein